MEENIGKFGDVSVNLPKFFHPNIINALRGSGALTKFAQGFPTKCTDRACTLLAKMLQSTVLAAMLYVSY